MPIDRREILKAISASAMLLTGAGCADAFTGKNEPQSERTNIIIILADDMGYGDLGCYGSETIRTPNIDALVAGGMKFTDFHSNCPVCSPTRAALLTGRYQQRCGIEGVVTAKDHRDKGMSLKETTFAEVLKEAGYATAVFGKWHLGYQVEFNPTKQGFDRFAGYVSGNVDYISHIDQAGCEDWWKGTEKLDEKGYSTDLITQHGVEFIKANRDRPFCLYLPHEAPHYPLQGRNDGPIRTVGNPAACPSRKDRAMAYKEMIEVLDEGVGLIVETVRELGLERKTFVFFFSDNGATDMGSNGNLRGYKGSVFEGGHRVPAIAYWAGRIKSGTVTDQTAIGMDMFPTVAAIAGVKVPKNLQLDGIDLSDVIFQQGRLRERTLFWRYNNQEAVRRGPWKLVVLPGRKKATDSEPAVSLYNLDDDIGETTDLSVDNPKLTKQLLDELTRWEADVSKGVERQS